MDVSKISRLALKYGVRRWAALLAGIANTLAIATLFFTEPDAVEPASTAWEWWPWIARAQFMPAVLALDFAVLAGIAAATVLLGRIYCESVCPLGVFQDVLRTASCTRRLSVRRVCPRLPSSRPEWAVRLAILAATVAAAAAGFGAFWLDPYAIFCRALAVFPIEETDAAFALLAAIPFEAVAILSFVGKGRVWCNVICPVGTVFALATKKEAFATPFRRSCGECRACFPKTAQAPAAESAAPAKAPQDRT